MYSVRLAVTMEASYKTPLILKWGGGSNAMNPVR